MLKQSASLLEPSDILALLREFNSEAENILAHMKTLDRACQQEQESLTGK